MKQKLMEKWKNCVFWRLRRDCWCYFGWSLQKIECLCAHVLSEMGWWVILKTTSFSLFSPSEVKPNTLLSLLSTFLLWYVFMIHSACHALAHRIERFSGDNEIRFHVCFNSIAAIISISYYSSSLLCHVTQIFPLICSLWWQTLLAGHWQMGSS